MIVPCHRGTEAYNRSMVDKGLLEQALQLPSDERLELADALRASVDWRDPELTDEVRVLLEAAAHDARVSPGDERPWADARHTSSVM